MIDEEVLELISNTLMEWQIARLREKVRCYGVII